MNRRTRSLAQSALSIACLTGMALACGTPPVPPPPPPAPPIVCCRIAAWFIDPICKKQVLILCYFRQDGLPLYQSNPMPLLATQQCACGLSALPHLPGVMEGGISFGLPGNPLQSCLPMAPDQPGYGPFTPPCDNQLTPQINSFFDVFYSAANIPPTSTGCNLSSVFQFGGPGTIPPGIPFVVYRKVIVPRGFNPATLCTGESAIGLFLVNNGTAFAEPPQQGLPPVSFAAFAGNPGASAFYKVKCLPLDLPGPCPLPTCPGDANGDGSVNFADITSVFSHWLVPCPP